ncbi:pantoate--beta-alanine ligase [Virgibacillus dokdonensis]|uniref:Pantothenate synthetase n=1 Tax=Virgibacillus dokdonensis TaxID=302167 RepID=A0A3E0WLC0_9BACI|nr:pantoate--beta-alanine ligase [Virgibacillus dokdonensis]RFA32776.1 pantoate--beta-alanine ligase [Virgibacillus dokdonensis]
MRTITLKQEMYLWAKQVKTAGHSIGFVPTMGFLHEGHLALVEEAKRDNDYVIMSIFVNPLQFGQGEDYTTYPRDEKRDKKLAEEAGVDILFMPSVDHMYKHKKSIKLMVTEKTDKLCGATRPGHFDGVVTVLTKLFHLTIPNRAYFGLKDVQQFAIVTALVEEFDFPVEIVPVDTVREPSGLAISSRNVKLTREDKEKAPALFNSLLLGKKLIIEGETDANVIIKTVRHYLDQQLGENVEVDYVEMLTFPYLEDISEVNEKVVIAVAVRFLTARLIDNIIVEC